MSSLGVFIQCMTLWHYKKTGKEIHPKLQDAVINFQYGRTAEQRKRDKDMKKLQKIIDEQMGSSVDNESLYIDL